MDLTITGFTAAALAILLVLLALDTIRNRFRTRVAFGLGDDPGLTSASRAHGNLAENAPIVLILIGLLEVGGADRQILTWVAGAFVAARRIAEPALNQELCALQAVAHVTTPFPPSLVCLGFWQASSEQMVNGVNGNCSYSRTVTISVCLIASQR